jgi:hypothetical protein
LSAEDVQGDARLLAAPYESLDLFGTLIVGEYRLGSLHAQETTPMNYQAELNKASQTVQKQIAETEEKIGEVQNEFAKTLDVMSRAAMSRATAEVELGLKLSHKLSTARSPLDTLSACQEWLTEEMKARTEDARQFMTNCQSFVSEGTRVFSNGGSKRRMSR